MYSVQYNNTFKVQILYRYVSKDSKQIETVQNIPFQCTAKHEKGISLLFQLSCPPPIGFATVVDLFRNITAKP